MQHRQTISVIKWNNKMSKNKFMLRKKKRINTTTEKLIQLAWTCYVN